MSKDAAASRDAATLSLDDVTAPGRGYIPATHDHEPELRGYGLWRPVATCPSARLRTEAAVGPDAPRRRRDRGARLTRTRTVLGLIGGAMLVLSSAAHSLLGWKEMSAPLVAAHVPADLIQGLAFGWHFGGAAMLAFGCLVIALLVKRLRGEAVPAAPLAIVAALYIGFGVWALYASKLKPFYLVFIVPGVLLALAAPSGRQNSTG